jgi:FkbM family methyltransferase
MRLYVMWREGITSGGVRRRWRELAWALAAWRHEQFDVRMEPDVAIRLYRDDALSKLIFVEDFERRERRFLKAFLRRGDTFVDVGANIGLFAVMAGRYVGPEGRVLAFEPGSRAFARLQANVALNRLPSVECYRTALSDGNATLPMKVSLGAFDAWNSFGGPTAGSEFVVETVPCVAWDAFARANGLVGRVTMIKIDVEGWETRVLRGGTETLSRDDAPVLQVEFSDQAALAAGSSCQELYRCLEDMGYRLYRYDEGKGTLVQDPLRSEYPYQNLIAAKRLDAMNARLASVA